VRPLEYWRGERIQYKIGRDWCFEVAGIDPGRPSRQWVGAGKRPGKLICFIVFFQSSVFITIVIQIIVIFIIICVVL
jgi:hypothetical protein